jgi:hypothetical protein
VVAEERHETTRLEVWRLKSPHGREGRGMPGQHGDAAPERHHIPRAIGRDSRADFEQVEGVRPASPGMGPCRILVRSLRHAPAEAMFS